MEKVNVDENQRLIGLSKIREGILIKHPLHPFPIIEGKRKIEKVLFLYTTIDITSNKSSLDIV